MDKTKLGVVAATLTSLAIPAVAPAQSFADLLAPIPNAAARLQEADMQGPAPQLIQAQYHDHHHNNYTAQYTHHHHHQAYVATHHHHHSYYRRYHRRHHRSYYQNQHHHHHDHQNY